jgi:hypothetical protein
VTAFGLQQTVPTLDGFTVRLDNLLGGGHVDGVVHRAVHRRRRRRGRPGAAAGWAAGHGGRAGARRGATLGAARGGGRAGRLPGAIYESETFRRSCQRLGISLQPARPGTPTDKGIVERTLQSVNTLFCQHVAGYTAFDALDRSAAQGLSGVAAGRATATHRS